MLCSLSLSLIENTKKRKTEEQVKGIQRCKRTSRRREIRRYEKVKLTNFCRAMTRFDFKSGRERGRIQEADWHDSPFPATGSNIYGLHS